MAKKRRLGTTIFMLLLTLLAFGAFAPAFAPLPSLSSSRSNPGRLNYVVDEKTFEIADDMFWKDGKPFQTSGGDLHYFRILPEYWEDRLLRAKALGLNTIQTYVPWNLHEPREGYGHDVGRGRGRNSFHNSRGPGRGGQSGGLSHPDHYPNPWASPLSNLFLKE